MCISFGLHRGTVVIPKTVNLTRIIENYKATSLALDKEDMDKLAGIDKNFRLLKVIVGNVVVCVCVCVLSMYMSHYIQISHHDHML